EFDLDVKDAILDTLARAGDTAFDKETRKRIRDRLGINERQLGSELTKRRKEIEAEKRKAAAEAAAGNDLEPDRECGEPGQPGYFASGGKLFRRENGSYYPLTDFDAWIVEEIEFVGGTNPRNEFI